MSDDLTDGGAVEGSTGRSGDEGIAQQQQPGTADDGPVASALSAVGPGRPPTPAMLARERERVVRMCLRFTGGNADLAEDLAQEALIESLRSLDQLRDPEAWRSWLAGIARNVCLRWARRHATEQERTVRLPDLYGSDADAPGGASPPPAVNGSTGSIITSASSPLVLVTADEIDTMLEHEEVAGLLDRAMSRIPERMRDILIEHYVDDLPQAEIAARRGIREETIAVQMHRGRRALRDALISPELRREAAELGLIADASVPWQETHIWCPICGKRRMHGKFNAGEERTGEVNEYLLRCPDCHADTDLCFTSFRFDENVHLAEVIKGVKGFKPALNRLNNWLHSFYKRALERGRSECLMCGRPVRVELTVPSSYTDPEFGPVRAAFLGCESCGTFNWADVDALSLWQPDAQAFWRAHPRIRVLPSRDITTTSGPALLTRIESVTSREVLDIVTARDSLGVLEILPGSR